jgi:hypothetical protein
MKYYDKLIFELSKPGRIGFSLPIPADRQQLPFGNTATLGTLRGGTASEAQRWGPKDVSREELPAGSHPAILYRSVVQARTRRPLTAHTARAYSCRKRESVLRWTTPPGRRKLR